MLSKSRLLFVISTSFLVILILAASLYWFLFRNSSQNSDDYSEPTLVDQSIGDINESVELIDEYFQFQKSENSKTAENITSIDELTKIPEISQHLVGIEVIEAYISKGNLLAAREFSVYLMSKDTIDGFDATFKCYETSISDEQREECFNRAQIIARQLGFTGEDENLPDDYLAPKEPENQDG